MCRRTQSPSAAPITMRSSSTSRRELWAGEVAQRLYEPWVREVVGGTGRRHLTPTRCHATITTVAPAAVSADSSHMRSYEPVLSMIAPKIGGAVPNPVRNPNRTTPEARPVEATPASTITESIPTEFHELD